MEKLLGTRSVIARPTDTGYAGVCVQWDGYPSDRLSLLLTARRYRFGGDLDALARHLIDEAPEGWRELGTDLLDDAPATLRTELVGDDDQPSSKHNAMFVTTIGDVGPEPHTITEQSSRDLDWGYVLHPHGIEVISALGRPRPRRRMGHRSQNPVQQRSLPLAPRPPDPGHTAASDQHRQPARHTGARHRTADRGPPLTLSPSF